MTSEEVRDKFLNFFKERGHAVIPSASLVPQDDPTTLLTGSGMQPLIPYLFGKEHPEGKRLVDSQKCFRAEDIDEIGDNRHTTFFEMLGNWSLGDYFKQEQLPWFFEFLTDVLGISPENLYVTVFSGDEDNGIPRDEESARIWKELFKSKGIDAKDIELLNVKTGGERGMDNGRIFYYDSSKNWWSRKGAPAEMPPGELGGPDSEVFYEFKDIEHDASFGKHCHPNCDCGRFIEIGNSVFMEYKKDDDGTFSKLAQRNVDFGGGLERLTAVSENTNDVFSTDLFSGIMDAIGKIAPNLDRKTMRVLADHLRGSVFLIADGVTPSNKGGGYILRRLLRRIIAYQVTNDIHENLFSELVPVITEKFSGVYKELKDADAIIGVMEDEKKKFRTAIASGLKELSRYDKLTPTDAFRLYESYGLPFELINELAKDAAKGITREDFEKELEHHRELSRAGAERKFGGHGLLLDTGEIKAADEEELKKATRLHTATHLLQAALRSVLGDDVRQMGSDITAKRIRFDFVFSRKMSPDEIEKVESLVNDVISKDIPFQYKEMPLEDAKKTGALFMENGSYPETVKVYYSGNSIDDAFSKELCGGPHVSKTGDVGRFKIRKEESVSAGVRRIRADIE